MSMSHFHTVLIAVLLLPFSTLPLGSAPRQNVKQGSASVTINPPEATVHVGQTQTFEAIVRGTQSTGIRWTIDERNGGLITEDRIYTAPRRMVRWDGSAMQLIPSTGISLYSAVFARPARARGIACDADRS